jgi:hypothetical protein
MSATDGIRITGLKLAKASSTPRRSIASFDLEFFGIEMLGFELVRTASDGLTIRAPSSCSFTDARVHSMVKRASSRAYVALGGDDLPEWALRSALQPVLSPAETEAA